MSTLYYPDGIVLLPLTSVTGKGERCFLDEELGPLAMTSPHAGKYTGKDFEFHIQ